MSYAQMRDGARLHYLSFGRGPDVCVLLHGFAMNAAMWVPFVAPLAHRVRFIIPDLRGFGRSHKLPLHQRSILDQHADDLHDLLDALNLHDVHLGGLSMGACTALQYQRRYGFGRIRAYLHMRMWAGLAQFTSYAFHHRGMRAIGNLARHERLIRRVAPTANWPIYLDCLRSYMDDDYDWRPSLSQIKTPTTLLIGLQSRMYPAAGQFYMAKQVPQARAVPIDNCGHVIPFEAPRVFLRELNRFLAPAPALPRTRRARIAASSTSAA